MKKEIVKIISVWTFVGGLGFGQLSAQTNIPYHTLRDDQVVIAAFPFSHGSAYIKEVENVGNETHVTFAQNMYYSSNWTQHTSTSYLLDPRTNERIYPIGMTNEMPLDSVLLVKNHENSVALFTLRFPKLDSEIKEIIYTERSNPDYPVPSNGTGNQTFYVNLEEYCLANHDEPIVARLNRNKRYTLHNKSGYRISLMEFDEVHPIEVEDHKFYQAITHGSMYLYDELGRKVFDQPHFHVEPVSVGNTIKFSVKSSNLQKPVILNRGAYKRRLFDIFK